VCIILIIASSDPPFLTRWVVIVGALPHCDAYALTADRRPGYAVCI
jgi:hypothetical protein